MPTDHTHDEAVSREGLDSGLLADITRVLLPYLGPYSITTVKRASRVAKTAGDIVRIASTHIDDVAKRELFLKSAKAILGDYSGSATGTGEHQTSASAIRRVGGRPTTPITAELIQRGEAALAPIIGPLASVLADRHAGSAESSRDFFERLAGHLRTREEREAFFLSVRNFDLESSVGRA